MAYPIFSSFLSKNQSVSSIDNPKTSLIFRNAFLFNDACFFFYLCGSFRIHINLLRSNSSWNKINLFNILSSKQKFWELATTTRNARKALKSIDNNDSKESRNSRYKCVVSCYFEFVCSFFSLLFSFGWCYFRISCINWSESKRKGIFLFHILHSLRLSFFLIVCCYLLLILVRCWSS